MAKEVISYEKAKRSFSKRLITLNIIGAWALLFFSVPYGQVTALVTHVFSFVTVLVGIYTGIGHMDYRKTMEVTERVAERFKKDEL